MSGIILVRYGHRKLNQLNLMTLNNIIFHYDQIQKTKLDKSRKGWYLGTQRLWGWWFMIMYNKLLEYNMLRRRCPGFLRTYMNATMHPSKVWLDL